MHASLRIAALLLAAAAGMFGLILLARLLGYGTDIHYTRLGVAFGFLLIGGLIAFQSGHSHRYRLVLMAGTSVAAALIWWFMPDPAANGMTLYGAGCERDDLNRDIANLAESDYEQAARLQRNCDRLFANFPSLTARPREELDRWKDNAALSLKRQFHELPATEVSAGFLLWEKAQEYSAAFPDEAGRIEAACDDWRDRAVSHYCQECETFPSGDWDQFNERAGVRQRLFITFPQARERIAAAESSWVLESCLQEISRMHTRNPRQVREACLEIEKHISSLKVIDASSERFLKIRRDLFDCALDAADAETSRHIAAGRSDIAYGIARKFAVDWFAAASRLGSREQKLVEDLREKCRDKVMTAGPAAVEPELVPLPRVVEAAPEPRTKP